MAGSLSSIKFSVPHGGVRSTQNLHSRNDPKEEFNNTYLTSLFFSVNFMNKLNWSFHLNRWAKYNFVFSGSFPITWTKDYSSYQCSKQIWFLEANTQSSQTLNSFLIINSPICCFRNAIHTAEWFAKSLSMDKTDPCPETNTTDWKIPIPAVQTLLLLYMNELFSALSKSCASRSSTEDVAI